MKKRQGTALLCVAALCVTVLVAACAAEEEPAEPGETNMSEDLRTELERIYGTVRTAFAEFDLEAARPYIDVPEGSPEPTREQALAMAEFLPDVSSSKFVSVRHEGDRAAYYMETEVDDPGTTAVAVIRFQKGDAGWKLAPGPHTLSEYSAERKEGAGVETLIEEQESLAPFPALD